jgi:hypothetical protein
MAEDVTEYHRGQMDIRAQQTTFQTVMVMTKWASLAVVVGVTFFTLLFCTPAGFGSSLMTAVVLAAVGGFALKDRPAAAH